MSRTNNQGYLGNDKVKRDGITHNFTQHEIEEYMKCMEDPCYFAKKYVKIISLDEGLVNFNLYDYQERYLNHLKDNRFSITLACRQSGKSITSVVFILWYVTFHPEKTVAILANKGATAREMLSRIALALENLPFFLQAGCKELNKGSMTFSNNSKIVAAATSASSIRGMSISLLFLDEFAFIENDEVFYTSTYPVVSSGKETKIIITSTMNGIGNVFYRIWEGANQGANEFKPFRIDWWDVPGRDEEWKRQTIANTSLTQFRQEFGNEAIGRGNNLISNDSLLGLQVVNEIKNENNVRIYEEPKEGHNYIMTVDVAQGRGSDYSTFTIIDTTSKPFEVVAIFQDNMISPILFPSIIHRYAMMYNEAYILVENNDSGVIVCNALYYDIEYDNMFVESVVKSGSIGVRMTKKVKRIGCSNLKDLIESKELLIKDHYMIRELCTFESVGTSFAAASGNHDDLVMNLVLFSWFASTNLFNEMTNIDLKTLLYEEKLKSIEEEMTPVGFFNESDNSYEVDKEGNVWTEVKRTKLF